MKVCQIRQVNNLLVGVDDNRRVNFTQWRNTDYVSLSFMDADGQVKRYRIYEDGTVHEDVL